MTRRGHRVTGRNIFVVGGSGASWGSSASPHAGGDVMASGSTRGGDQWNTFCGSEPTRLRPRWTGAGTSVTGGSDATWGAPRTPSPRAATPSSRASTATGRLPNDFLGGRETTTARVSGWTTGGDVTSPGGAIRGSPGVRAAGGYDAHGEGRARDTRRHCHPAVARPPAASTPTSASGWHQRYAARHQRRRAPAETVCVAGAINSGGSSSYRGASPSVIWPNVVKFNTTKTEVWIEQISTGAIRYYLPPALPHWRRSRTGGQEGLLP
jgi:hypothetical protein